MFGYCGWSVTIEIQTRHYSTKTEKTYRNWIKQYVLFHKKRHPNEMSEKEVNQFLSHLAVAIVSLHIY
ncbi:MAG: phage integrase N-terminal SAM-like domain-containing protein [Candidatus Marinimicrobia bacterium]|nr:phage integrase N-terminal SAM-like domain-containing protein [Candidatus Neomarinimicrobiota bacterium]